MSRIDDAIMGLVLIDGVVELAAHYNPPADDMLDWAARIDAWYSQTQGGFFVGGSYGRGSGKTMLGQALHSWIIDEGHFIDESYSGYGVITIDEYRKVLAEPIICDKQDYARPSNGKGWYRDFERKAHGKGKRKRW